MDTDDKDVVFILTKEDVLSCARELDIPEEKITDEALERIKQGVGFGLEHWSEVVKVAIEDTLMA